MQGSFPKKNSGNAEFERWRREDRGAEGAKGVRRAEGSVSPSPPGEESGEGENFSILDLK